MWIAWGNMRAGRVEAADDSAIVTDYFHVCFLPVWPRQSWVVPAGLGAFEEPDLEIELLTPLPRLHRRSVALGFARTWSLAIAAGAALSFLVRATSDQIVGHAMMLGGGCVPLRLSDVWVDDVPTLFAGALALVLGLVGAALLRAGRLDAMGRAQRRVYWLVAGAPVDPAHLPPCPALREAVVDTATSWMAQGGYRTPRQPERDWPAIALDPTVTDCTFVARAFTLARAEQVGATPARARELDAAHVALWTKLQALATAQEWTAPDEHAVAHAAEQRQKREARRPRSAWLPLLVALVVLFVLFLFHIAV